MCHRALRPEPDHQRRLAALNTTSSDALAAAKVRPLLARRRTARTDAHVLSPYGKL
jgi:hypothetical protein